VQARSRQHYATPMSSWRDRDATVRANGASGSERPDAGVSSVDQRTPAVDPARESLSGQARTTRVLVVEDQMDLRETTVAILRSEDYVVVNATDGLEALRKLDGNDFDVMLLDLQLPGKGGAAVLAELDNPPVVVIVSAFRDEDESAIRERFGSKVFEYLRKPVSPIRLVATTGAAAAAAQRRSQAS
jgi:CheY-like chemotaxis protein